MTRQNRPAAMRPGTTEFRMRSVPEVPANQKGVYPSKAQRGLGELLKVG